MIERRGRVRFAQEALAGRRVVLQGGERNVSATWRCSEVSSARKTSPMPPRPIFTTIRYCETSSPTIGKPTSRGIRR